MQRVMAFTLGVAAGVMLCWGATNFHVVRAVDGFHVVHKQRARLAEAYVDVRAFGASEWAKHPELVSALVAENKQGVLQGAAANTFQGGLSQLPKVPAVGTVQPLQQVCRAPGAWLGGSLALPTSCGTTAMIDRFVLRAAGVKQLASPGRS